MHNVPAILTESSSRKMSIWVQRDLLDGIGFFLIHPPQAYWKKSSQGLAVGSIDSFKFEATKKKIKRNYVSRLQYSI